MVKRRKSSEPKKQGDDYDVGYGKPPVHSRFKPGKSGNPAGRKKGLCSLSTDVAATLAMPVKIKENGRLRRHSTQQVSLLVMREKMMKGDARALDRFLELAARHNSQPTDSGPSESLSADDQAILDAYAAEIAASKAKPAVSAPPREADEAPDDDEDDEEEPSS